MEALLTLTEDEKACLQQTESTAYVVRTQVREELGRQVAAEVQALYSSHIANPYLDIFQLAGMGSSKVIDTSYRNDVKCWITPSLCKEHCLTATMQLVKGMVNLCGKQLKAELGLNSDYSVQLACFPGHGSRYIRHRDTFFDASGRPTNASTTSGPCSYRKLTCIYYLNEEVDGGQLRLFHPQDSSFEDVQAQLGSLVLFRSEVVEHEVLPSFRNRFAITMWASATFTPSPLQTSFLPTDADHSWKYPLSLTHLHIDEKIQSCASSRSIYISFANYRDSEAPKTLLDLFLKADRPQRVFVGHVFQGTEEDKQDCTLSQSLLGRLQSEAGCSERQQGFAEWSSSHVKTVQLPLHDATGPCYARHLALQPNLFGSQDYILQIDSHMRFRPGWDTYLIGLLEKVKTEQGDHCQPILTTYPLGYTLPNTVPNSTLPTILLPQSFDESGILRQSSKVAYISNNAALPYMRSPLWAAGFSFSDAHTLLDVPYDPSLPFLFFGEEMSMAARFYTHGYRFFAPSTNVLYHLYSRGHRPNFTQSEAAKSKLQEQRTQSLQRVKQMLLLGEEEPCHNEYGLGNKCTIASMEAELGLSFSQHQLHFDANQHPDHWTDYITSHLSPKEATVKLSASVDVVEDEKLLIEEVLRTQLQCEGSTNNLQSVFGKVCMYLNR